MNLQVLGRINDHIGYLILNESGAIVASGGDLENDEQSAEIIFNLVSISHKIDSVAFSEDSFNKISVCFKDFCYVICLSNKKIHVIKRKCTPGLSKTPQSLSMEQHVIETQVPITNSINS